MISAQSKRNKVRECVAGPGEREQEILTPDSIIDAVTEFFHGEIALDPCSNADRNVPALEHWYEDGLGALWPLNTFANPPYGDLKSWIPHALKCYEVIVLAPVRTHRTVWFNLNDWDAVCFLPPLKFKGYKVAFPMPLCLLYQGCLVDRFRDQFEAHGNVVVPRALESL